LHWVIKTTAAILPGRAEETKQCNDANNFTIDAITVNCGNICHQYLHDNLDQLSRYTNLMHGSPTPMATELAGLIQADLAALTNDASRLAVAPAIDAGQLVQGSNSGNNVSFMQSMRDAVASVDNEQRAAGEKMAAVDSGKSDDLVGAMLSSQQASLSFSMLMQVRNKVMGAMDELLKLPV
jgi:flagellar hook-basal body complex protein FliE